MYWICSFFLLPIDRHFEQIVQRGTNKNKPIYIKKQKGQELNINYGV